MMKRFLIAFGAFVLLLPSLPLTAIAQGYDHRWHGDIHHFHDYDFGRWRGGGWFHGPHGGRDGWWWIVDDQWYFYPAPVYPYPDPYLPPGVAVAPPGVSYLYYCRRPAGYYPYVPACYGRWHPVVAESPPAPAVPPPVAVAPSPVPPSNAAPLSVPMPDNLTQRERDDRQLNAFAVELQQIDMSGPQAKAKLRELAARVDAYHHALFTRDYNAMDILRDTENLQQRIAAEQASLRH